MPRRDQHVKIGIAVAAFVIFVLILMDEDQRRSVLEHVGAGLGALGGSVAPDIAEPATTPNHRKFFHSAVALAGMGAVALDPPDQLVAWRDQIRSAAKTARHKREALPSGHSRRPNLWLKECTYHMAAGASIGFPLGYGSHLLADSDTSDLPLIGIK